MRIETLAMSRITTVLLPLILFLFPRLGWADASRTVPTSLLPLHRQLRQEIEQSAHSPSHNHIPTDVYPSTGEEVRTGDIISDEVSPTLSNPGWVALNQVATGAEGIPLPRRGHSSTIRTIRPHNSGVDTVEENDDHTITSSNGNVTAPGDNGATRRIDYVQEYMIISGGFTSEEWSTFPVWSYDITGGVLNNHGKWELKDNAMREETCTGSHEAGNSNSLKDGNLWNNASNCPPPSRYGHMSVALNDYLYVFGGLLFNEKKGVFFMEDEPYIYRLNMSRSSRWQRIVAIVKPPHHTENNYIVSENTIINRGEGRGGYWEEEGKMIIYGGLHVGDYTTQNGKLQQEDKELGDVWAYDFELSTWEVLATLPSKDDVSASRHYPEARTSHAATIVGNQLVICGGLKKVETMVFDGTTVWEQLADVWIFDLNTRVWRERSMAKPIGRSHHSLVGWKDSEGDGPVVASFGGYKTVYDTMSSVPRPMSYVYDETLISFPPEKNLGWLKVAAKNEGPSCRREHSAVLSEYGNMLIWGGRLKTTEDSKISGVWSLNVKSSLTFEAQNDDDEDQTLEEFYLLVTTIFFISMMFTYMCGTLARQSNNDINDGMMNPGDDFGFESSANPFGRSNGLGQDIIDTLPLKTYHNNNALSNDVDGEQGISPQLMEQTLSSNNVTTEANRDMDEDEDCCAICLVIYKEGDELRSLPCKHDFHKSCVDAWLGNNASCPACRYSLQNLTNLTVDSSHPMSWARISNLTLLGSNLEDGSEIGTGQNNSPNNRARGFSFMERFQSQGSRTQISASNPEVAVGGEISTARTVDDFALVYSSSIELTEDMSSHPNLENRIDTQSMTNDDSIHNRSCLVRVVNERRTRVRRTGRRRVGNARSPLNDPLQPPPNNAIIV